MLALVLGLGSSLCWGLADFYAGLQARRRSVIAVLLVSQLAGLVGIAALAPLVAGGPPGEAALGWALAAGAAGALALMAFYRALAIGTMSVVAPVSATGACIPVAVGVLAGERPTPLQALGIVAAVAGIVLASRQVEGPLASRGGADRALPLALVAALGFGLFFVAMDRAAAVSVPWALVLARAASTGLVAVLALARPPALPRDAAALGSLAVIGLLDLTANGLYALATTTGLLSVVAVLGSLYPAVTVVLARLVLGERLTRGPRVGVVLTLAGVALIASA